MYWFGYSIEEHLWTTRKRPYSNLLHCFGITKSQFSLMTCEVLRFDSPIWGLFFSFEWTTLSGWWSSARRELEVWKRGWVVYVWEQAGCWLDTSLRAYGKVGLELFLTWTQCSHVSIHLGFCMLSLLINTWFKHNLTSQNLPVYSSCL